MRKVTGVVVLDGYKLELSFDDGAHGIVDLAAYAGKGVFSKWNDMEAFRAVRVGDYGELCWGPDIDLCPDALYMECTGHRPEEVFPSLKREGVNA